MKKWKSVFRYVNYDVSWGSPCPQKYKTTCKTHTKKNNGFLPNKRWFFNEKVGRSSVHSKHRENNCRGTPIFGKNTFFCKFGGPWGNPKIAKTGRAFQQKTIENNGPFQNSTFLIWGWLCKASGSILKYLGVPKLRSGQKGPQETIFSYFSTYPSSSPLSPPFLPKPLQTLHLQPNPTPKGTHNPQTLNLEANPKPLYPHTSTSSKPASFTRGLGGMRVAAWIRRTLVLAF